MVYWLLKRRKDWMSLPLNLGRKSWQILVIRVCMYLWPLYIYIYIYTYTSMYVYVQVQGCIYGYVCTCVFGSVVASDHAHACMHACVGTWCSNDCNTDNSVHVCTCTLISLISVRAMRALAPSLGIVAGFDLALRTYVLLPHTDLCGVVRQTRITMLPLFIHTYIHIYIYTYMVPPRPPGYPPVLV